MMMCHYIIGQSSVNEMDFSYIHMSSRIKKRHMSFENIFGIHFGVSSIAPLKYDTLKLTITLIC